LAWREAQTFVDPYFVPFGRWSAWPRLAAASRLAPNPAPISRMLELISRLLWIFGRIRAARRPASSQVARLLVSPHVRRSRLQAHDSVTGSVVMVESGAIRLAAAVEQKKSARSCNQNRLSRE
jgi:hypothetical protein